MELYRRPFLIVIVVLLGSACIQVGDGFMTPGMVHRVMAGSSSGVPPLQPHVPGEVSADCLADLTALLADKEMDLITVLDAIGKPQSGLLAGNLAWIGHFDECINITDFKYCMTHLSVPVNSSEMLLQELQIAWGICVPVSCSDSDILSSLDMILDAVAEYPPINISSANASSVSCAKQPPVPYDTGFLVTIFIIVALGILLFLGAFLDCTLRSTNYMPPSPSQGLHINADQTDADPVESREIHENDIPSACTQAWHKFLLSFAINRNIVKLLSVESSEGSIECLNGIRVISMSWVILGHTVAFSLNSGIIGNPLTGLSIIEKFGFQAISNAVFSVDSFFFLSGLLVAYLTLGRMEKTKGSIPWLWFYFHRYWRLTPAMGMTMLISLFIKPHMGNGPVWQGMQTSDPGCAKNWWTNLLYINNFFQVENGCIGWVWYLANDMQFFIISPVILILLYRVPVLGLMSLAGMTTASAVTTTILMAKGNYSAALDLFGDQNSFGDVIYIKPYCRISPYLIGMAMGYLLNAYKKKKFNLHPSVVAGGWAIATATAMAVVYGLYGDYHGNPLSTTANAIYMALSKIAWSFSLCWLVFACHYGYGGWINEFLSWKLWFPLSRVTYSAYLLHPIIIFSFYFNMKNNYFYSLYLVSFEFVGLFIMAYGAAVVMALFIEFPLGNLEKMIIPSRRTKTQ